MMNVQTILKLLAVLALSLSMSGCMTYRWGPSEAPEGFDYQGIANAYASLNDLRDYDGDILQVDILNNRQLEGELVNLDLWPIAGLGVGVVGLRARFFIAGAGVGSLFYKPLPQGDWSELDDKEVTVDVDD